MLKKLIALDYWEYSFTTVQVSLSKPCVRKAISSSNQCILMSEGTLPYNLHYSPNRRLNNFIVGINTDCEGTCSGIYARQKFQIISEHRQARQHY